MILKRLMVGTGWSKLADNVLWSSLDAGAAAGLSFVSGFAVAGMIGPAEVGVAAAAVSLHVLLWVGVNALFADALVQRARLSEVAAASGFWGACVAGLLGGLVQIAASVPVAAVIGDQRIMVMSIVLAAALPLVGAAGAMQGMATRAAQYRLLASRTVIGQGLGTIAGVGLACAGWGAWSLVAQQAVISFAGALVLIVASPWRPQRHCRWVDIRMLLGIGLPLTASTLVQHGRYRLFAILIGATAGSTALGQVHLAFRLIDTVRELAITALWRLALPAMAGRQDDLAALRTYLHHMLRLAGTVLFPLFAAIGVVIAPVVSLLLGPAWGPSAGAAAILAAVAAQSVLVFPSNVAAVARGRARFALAGNLAALALTGGAVIVLRPENALAAAAIWSVTQLAIAPFVLHATARVLQMSILDQISAGLPPLNRSIAAAGAALTVSALHGGCTSPIAEIALRVGVVIATYAALIGLSRRGPAGTMPPASLELPPTLS